MTSSTNHNSDAPRMPQLPQYLPLFQNSFQIIFNFFPETFEKGANIGAFGAFLGHSLFSDFSLILLL
tara:strand:- start:108 stop:308 length:201 start_codon:yes stop_codon:yes gene_type:complete